MVQLPPDLPQARFSHPAAFGVNTTGLNTSLQPQHCQDSANDVEIRQWPHQGTKARYQSY
jgi:hypothetical protein